MTLKIGVSLAKTIVEIWVLKSFLSLVSLLSLETKEKIIVIFSFINMNCLKYL